MTTINERIAKAKGWEFDPGYQNYGAWFAHNEDGRLAYKAMKNGLPDWSGSIADAWELVEELRNLGPTDLATLKDGGWQCNCLRHGSSISRKAPTAQEAIALAWLAVNEGET